MMIEIEKPLVSNGLYKKNMSAFYSYTCYTCLHQYTESSC